LEKVLEGRDRSIRVLVWGEDGKTVGTGEAGGGCEPARACARSDATAHLRRVYANGDPRRILFSPTRRAYS
jgi:hypothetical protein